jgi:hypothetical protein
MRLWSLIKVWLGAFFIELNDWPIIVLDDWWHRMTAVPSSNRKAMGSLTLLVTWGIWDERNARVF